uniref:Uncharacterized protein n=1 Tax=Anguilla anguilla TaxID=7936 RepID=A0A0E9VLX3_ANGAN
MFGTEENVAVAVNLLSWGCLLAVSLMQWFV